MLMSNEIWLRSGLILILGIVGGTAAVVLEVMSGISQDLGNLQQQITQVDKIHDISDRLLVLEKGFEEVDADSVAYLQLSSARTQLIQGQGQTVHMELRDAQKGIGFDPRLSDSKVSIEKDGSYFVLAAPQVMATGSKAGCYHLWMAVNGSPVANSNIKVCHNAKDKGAYGQTTVALSQGVLCLHKGDFFTLEHSGTGIQASPVIGEPLIPSIIFSMFRLGAC